MPRPLPPELRHLLPLLHSRERIEALVENLVGLLDAFDGDPDREAEEDCCLARDDEPRREPDPYPCYRDPHPGTPEDAELLLGWSAALNQEPHHLTAGQWDTDRESDGRADDEPDHDGEAEPLETSDAELAGLTPLYCAGTMAAFPREPHT